MKRTKRDGFKKPKNPLLDNEIKKITKGLTQDRKNFIANTLHPQLNKRFLLANAIREHRKKHFNHTYTLDRIVQTLKFDGIDLFQVVSSTIASSKRRPAVLISGAGFLGVDIGLKRKFGKEIHLTSLNIIHPKKRPFTQKDHELKEQMQDRLLENIHYFPTGENNTQRVLTTLRAEEVDRIKVASAERFTPKNQFDII